MEMLASAVVYLGLVMAFAGSIFVVKPIQRLRVPTRLRGLAMAGAGLAVAVIGLALPAPESRVSLAETRLDEFTPVWQFREFHTIRIAAPPARVYEAIKHVRADEIFLFNTLTWIRRGGRSLPNSILDAGSRGESLIDIALQSGFVSLADDFPKELVVGTVVMAPPGTRGRLTPQVFQHQLPPGFALATMNFVVNAEGSASLVTTETRVFANSPSARRRFAAYWRLIYPGSAIIRRSWLRAIQRSVTSA
jgi:hypothetical protein